VLAETVGATLPTTDRRLAAGMQYNPDLGVGLAT
jgi:predicted nucleic acid-binding protein